MGMNVPEEMGQGELIYIKQIGEEFSDEVTNELRLEDLKKQYPRYAEPSPGNRTTLQYQDMGGSKTDIISQDEWGPDSATQEKLKGKFTYLVQHDIKNQTRAQDPEGQFTSTKEI